MLDFWISDFWMGNYRDWVYKGFFEEELQGLGLQGIFEEELWGLRLQGMKRDVGTSVHFQSVTSIPVVNPL
jgi:hypothetical protein